MICCLSKPITLLCRGKVGEFRLGFTNYDRGWRIPTRVGEFRGVRLVNSDRGWRIPTRVGEFRGVRLVNSDRGWRIPIVQKGWRIPTRVGEFMEPNEASVNTAVKKLKENKNENDLGSLERRFSAP